MENIEIEAKFLEIDKPALVQKLRDLGAQDLGRRRLRQSIFYDKAGEWMKDGKTFVRVREDGETKTLTYKREHKETLSGVEEIEVVVDDTEKTKKLLRILGLRLTTETEKFRHSFKLDNVVFDFDEWPQIPAWLEIEGPSEQKVKEAAAKLGLSWEDAVFGTASGTIEKYYKIVLRNLRYFTLEKIE